VVRIAIRSHHDHLVRISRIFGSKHSEYLDPNIQNIWIKTSRIFGSKHPEYLDINIQNICIQTSRIFRSKLPEYLDQTSSIFGYKNPECLDQKSKIFGSKYPGYLDGDQHDPAGNPPQIHSISTTESNKSLYKYRVVPSKLSCSCGTVQQSHLSKYSCNGWVQYWRVQGRPILEGPGPSNICP